MLTVFLSFKSDLKICIRCLLLGDMKLSTNLANHYCSCACQEKIRLGSSLDSLQHHTLELEAKLKDTAVELVQVQSALDHKQQLLESLQVGPVPYIRKMGCLVILY